MKKASPAGSRITAQQADHYLKQYVKVREQLQKEVVPILEKSGIAESEKEQLKNFYTSDINAFIFSRDQVERFFNGVDENGKPQEKAGFLMVILSAKFEGDKIGKPTVVIAGVNEAKEGTGYTALCTTYAATQQPPTEELLAFPGTDDCDPCQFNVVV